MAPDDTRVVHAAQRGMPCGQADSEILYVLVLVTIGVDDVTEPNLESYFFTGIAVEMKRKA